MRVNDVRRTFYVNSIDDLANVLSQRCESEFNAFWLTPSESEYPTLNVLIQSELAVLNFLETEDEPGFNSIGCVPCLDPDVFRISKNRADDVEIANTSIVTVTKAIEAAKEFFEKRQLPTCIDWFGLKWGSGSHAMSEIKCVATFSPPHSVGLGRATQTPATQR